MCGPRVSCACSGTVTPSLSLCPTPFSAMYTCYVHAGGVCGLSMVEQRLPFVLCAEGCCNDCERDSKYESAQFYACYMTWRPWLRFSRNLNGCGARRASGEVGPHGIFSDRKRYGSRQKAVAAELKSRGTMYRVELVLKTDTRLS